MVLKPGSGFEGALIEARGPVVIRGLTVEGGSIGLEVQGDLTLEGCVFRGQRDRALDLRGGRSQLRDLRFVASSKAEPRGLLLRGANVRMQAVRFEGPFARAVEASEGAALEWVQGRVEGSAVGMHAVSSSTRLRDIQLSGGKGPALFVSGGESWLEQVEVRGHEYALLTRQGARVQARGLVSTGAQRAGLGLIGAHAELDDVRVSYSGGFGAIQSHQSEVVLRNFQAARASASGIQARETRLRVERAVIVDTREEGGTEGDGIQLRQSEAVLESLTVRSAEGSGLVAAEGSTVEVDDLVLEATRTAGVVIEGSSEIRGTRVQVARCAGPVVAVQGEGTLVVDGLRLERNAHGVWASCEEGASVQLTQVTGDQKIPATPCVKILAQTPR